MTELIALPRAAGARRRRPDGERAGGRSATSSRRASAAATRGSSAPSSASRRCSGRCSAGSSSSTSRGAGSSTSTSRSAIVALVVIGVVLPARRRASSTRIDYLGVGAARRRALSAIVLFASARAARPTPGARRRSSALVVGRRRAARSSFVFVERRAAEPILPLAPVREPGVRRHERRSASSSASRCSGRSPTCRSSSRSCAASRPTSPGLRLLADDGRAARSRRSVAGQLDQPRLGRYRPFPIVGTALMTIGLVPAVARRA